MQLNDTAIKAAAEDQRRGESFGHGISYPVGYTNSLYQRRIPHLDYGPYRGTDQDLVRRPPAARGVALRAEARYGAPLPRLPAAALRAKREEISLTSASLKMCARFPLGAALRKCSCCPWQREDCCRQEYQSESTGRESEAVESGRGKVDLTGNASYSLGPFKPGLGDSIS
jgi:hypothetical protein